MTMPDPFAVPERTAHIVCINHRTAPQVYVVGADDNGQGGKRYRAKDGDHLYVGESVARALVKKGTFQFVAFEEQPQNEKSPNSVSATKTIDQLYAEQFGKSITEKIASANTPTSSEFAPTNQPSLQPSPFSEPEMPSIEEMQPPSTNIPVPTSEEFLKNIENDMPSGARIETQHFIDKNDDDDEEAERIARVAERIRRIRGR